MAILDRYAGFVLDLDSVLRPGDGVAGPVATFLRKAERSSRRVVFVTNDSSRTIHQIARELSAAKLSVDAADIITSAVGAATMLLAAGQPHTLGVGGAGLLAALAEAGIPLVDDPADAEAVVVGWDAEITLADLQRAATAIDAGARFLGTAADPIVHRRGGAWPGPGALLALLREATGAAAEVVGMPNPLLLEMAAARMELEGSPLVVGDGVGTDLAAANRLGWDTALVVDAADGHVELLEADEPPAWVIRSLGSLALDEPPIVRAASAADLTAVRDLLASAGFDDDEAASRLATTLVAQGPDGTLVGTVAWDLLDHAAHLRGVAVAAKERGHGTGSLLVARALMELRRTGCEWVYLLSPGAEQLFERLGFYRVHRDRVPAEILATAPFGDAANESNALVRRLR